MATKTISEVIAKGNAKTVGYLGNTISVRTQEGDLVCETITDKVVLRETWRALLGSRR